MSASSVSPAKRKLLDRLKRRGASTAAQLADELALTVVAVRQHLLALESRGWVAQVRNPPSGRGRPSVLWSLTADAESVFPNRHAELTVGLIEATRRALGEDGLRRVLSCRGAAVFESYQRDRVGDGASLRARVASLAQRRTQEGYMAEVAQEKPGVYRLIERHCPICDAARACAGLCSEELDLFRRVLGPGVSVERVEHVLSGERRCVYRIERERKRRIGRK